MDVLELYVHGTKEEIYYRTHVLRICASFTKCTAHTLFVRVDGETYKAFTYVRVYHWVVAVGTDLTYVTRNRTQRK